MTEIEKQFAVAFAQTDDERAMLLHLEDNPADITCRLILADSFEERGEDIIAKYQRQLTRIEELHPILDREPDNFYVRKILGSMLLKDSTQWDDHYRWEGLYYLWTVEHKKYPGWNYQGNGMWDWWTDHVLRIDTEYTIHSCIDNNIFTRLEGGHLRGRYKTRIRAEDDLRRVLVEQGIIK